MDEKASLLAKISTAMAAIEEVRTAIFRLDIGDDPAEPPKAKEFPGCTGVCTGPAILDNRQMEKNALKRWEKTLKRS